MLRPALIYVRCADACSHVKVLIQQRNSKAGIAAISPEFKKANFLLPEFMQLN